MKEKEHSNPPPPLFRLHCESYWSGYHAAPPLFSASGLFYGSCCFWTRSCSAGGLFAAVSANRCREDARASDPHRWM
jgi:hypothetical protein